MKLAKGTSGCFVTPKGLFMFAAKVNGIGEVAGFVRIAVIRRP